MVASDLEPLFAAAGKERQRAAGAMYGAGHSKNGSQKEVRADLPEASTEGWRSREQAAKAVGAKGRNVSTGASAMSTALVLQADGRRENGRWRRGSVDIGESPNKHTWQWNLKLCGIILDHAPHLAADVIVGSPNKRDVSFIVSGFVSSRFLYE